MMGGRLRTGARGLNQQVARQHVVHPEVVISTAARAGTVRHMQRFEYRVIALREKMIGGALSDEKLEEILNDIAREGWMLKSITHADVKGRIGPGAVEGLLLTFERPVAERRY